MTPIEKRNIETLVEALEYHGIEHEIRVDYHDDARWYVSIAGNQQVINMHPDGIWIRMDAFINVHNAIDAILGICDAAITNALFELAVRKSGYSEGES